MTSGCLYVILEQTNRISDENYRLGIILISRKGNALYNRGCLLVALQREGLGDFLKMEAQGCAQRFISNNMDY